MFVINFIDRQVLSVLIEPIKRELQLTDTQLGLLSGLAFALFYVTFAVPIARLPPDPPADGPLESLRGAAPDCRPTCTSSHSRRPTSVRRRSTRNWRACATASSIGILPRSVPSGAKQWTPSAAEDDLPVGASLSDPAPNPFRGTTRFSLSLPWRAPDGTDR